MQWPTGDELTDQARGVPAIEAGATLDCFGRARFHQRARTGAGGGILQIKPVQRNRIVASAAWAWGPMKASRVTHSVRFGPQRQIAPGSGPGAVPSLQCCVRPTARWRLQGRERSR